MRCWARVIFGIILLASWAHPRAAANELIVVYPQVKPPFDEIFQQIINGIEHQHPQPLRLYQIDGKTQVADIAKELTKDSNDLVIALGKSSYQVARQIQSSNSVVVGALPLQPSNIAGISLLTDPKILLNSLKMLAPAVNTVHVLHSESSRWLIQSAIDASATVGIDVVAEEVNDLKQAVNRYQELLQTIDPATTALWLPLDSITANEQVILPKILELAWERDIVVFSSKPEHAKRGALFSTFPDHFELGRELVIMVEQLAQGTIAATVVPTQQVQLAVNLRTANHLGLVYKPEVLRKIAITFK